ncbi:hypothetical protein IW261DRAFT_1565214 [Armillaria novae-zelandiae]|uniref:RING-CH-type domain-containing protein n=1 Tax=Armillaria novae-zelandiae TaxID=153914 RepID=A0AA39P608_9AGAR|nr:hypothetical protein IW261DRAFT_1565214 [Armillaria novae-zelandiae]
MVGREQDDDRANRDHVDTDERQCRICLDGADAERELGRLIRPCLCKGSISVSPALEKLAPRRRVHSSHAPSAITSIASRAPVSSALRRTQASRDILEANRRLSTSSASDTWRHLQPSLHNPCEPTIYYSSSYFYVSPLEVFRDLVSAALRIIQDEDFVAVFDEALPRGRGGETMMGATREPSAAGVLRNVIQRFLLGLPLIGAGSLIHMLFSLPFLGPLHWLARYRGNRRRNNNSRDITALIIIALIIVGAARALYKVYQLTQKVTKRLLLRAEDAILEVN